MAAIVLTAVLTVFGSAATPDSGQVRAPQEIEDWVRDLRSGKAERRRRAALALGRRGDEGAPALAEALTTSRDKWVRILAIHYLNELDAIPAEAAPTVGSFIDEHGYCGAASLEAALWRLDQAGSLANTLVVLAAQMNEADVRKLGVGKTNLDGSFRVVALLALSRMGKDGVVELLQRARKSKGPTGRPGDAYSDVRIALAAAARDAGRDCLGVLSEALEDSSRQLQAGALVALGALGPYATKTAPRMMELAGHHDESLRWRAMQALGSVRATGAELEALLLAALEDRSVRVRTQAARALLLTGRQEASARGCVVAALADMDEVNTTWALAVVGDVGTDFPNCVELLAAGLECEFEPVIVVSACALGPLGDAARAVLPRIRAADARCKGSLAGSAISDALKQIGLDGGT